MEDSEDPFVRARRERDEREVERALVERQRDGWVCRHGVKFAIAGCSLCDHEIIRTGKRP